MNTTIKCLPPRRIVILYTVSNACLGREDRAEENRCVEQTLNKLFAQRLLRQPDTELRVGDRFAARIEWFIPNFDWIRDGVYDRVTFCGPGCRLEVRVMIERILLGVASEIVFR